MATEAQSNPLLEPFTWGSGGRKRTPGQIEKDEKIAALLMKGGVDSSPIQHWTQGGARVMQALAGVIREKRAEGATLRNADHSNALLTNLINSQSQPSPAGPPITPQQQNISPFAPPPQADNSPFGAVPDLSNAPDVPQMTEAPEQQPVQPSITESPVAPTAQTAPQQQSAAPDNMSFVMGGKFDQNAPVLVNRLMKDLNLTRTQALAVVGNLGHESAGLQAGIQEINPLPHSGRGGLGWAQWTGPRRVAFEQFLQQNKLDPRDPEANYKFLLHEANGSHKYAFDALRQHTDLNRATVDFEQRFENAHANHKAYGSRLKFAQMADALMSRGVPPQQAAAIAQQQTQPNAQAQQPPIFLGDSHAPALAQFAKGKSLGVNGATIAQSIQQLQNAPQGSTAFMSAGTNDAVGQFNEQKIREQVAMAAQIAKQRGINLTWSGPTGPKGAALDAILADATKQNGINYRSMTGGNFAMQPDGIHAQINPQGYGAMWNALQQQPEQQAPQEMQPFQVAALGPVEAPQGVPQAQPTPPELPQGSEQLAQAQPFSINDMNFRAPSFAQQRPAMPQQQAQQPQTPARPAVNPLIVKALTDPYASPQVKQVAGALLQKEMTPTSYQFTTLPNGMVLRKDPKSGRSEVVNPYNNQVVNDPQQVPQVPRNTQFGLTPSYGVDQEGNPVALQFGNDGTVKRPTLPDGVTLSQKPIKIEGPTETVLMDPITRQVIQRIPKDIVGANRDKEIGGQQGKDIAGLPKFLDTSQEFLDVIKGIKEDPSLDMVLGWGSMLPNIPHTDIPRVRGRLEQLKGKQFLQAFDSLKGAGQITELEGTKATNAMARLKEASRPQDYRDALKDLEDVVTSARQRAMQRIQGLQQNQQQQAPQQNAPQQPARVRRYNPATGNLE